MGQGGCGLTQMHEHLKMPWASGRVEPLRSLGGGVGRGTGKFHRALDPMT